jgi:coenzyme PQQ precursor peptide PqqA
MGDRRPIVLVRIACDTLAKGEYQVIWKTPTVAEIALGAEINSYASASTPR